MHASLYCTPIISSCNQQSINTIHNAFVVGCCRRMAAWIGWFLNTDFGPRSLRVRTTTREPLKDLPNVPTARSLGWPDMERLAAWSALAAPAGLQREAATRWANVLAQLAKDPAWLAGVAKLGGLPAVRTAAETERFVRDQYELYEKLAKQLGLRQ